MTKRNNMRSKEAGLAKRLYAVFMTVMMVTSLWPSGATTTIAEDALSGDAVSAVSAAEDSPDSGEGAESDASASGRQAAAASEGAGPDVAGGSLVPGTYGNYTYRQNTATDAFTDSAYDGFRDSVATEWLGIAGSFHITAFDELTTSSHIYGNVLAKTMTGNNNFGQNQEYEKNYGYKPLSYVQNYTNPSGNPAGIDDGIFVVGSENTVTAVDNGNHLAINGVQMNSPKTLIQDADTASNPFIDLDAVKTYTTTVSDNLANVDEVGATVTNQGSVYYINYEGDSGCAYVTMKASELNAMSELYVKGMQIGSKDSSAVCSVVINVDMDTDTLNLQKVHVLLPNGEKADAGESDSTVGYVMFNIKNSTSAMTINLSDVVLASVLAPNSTINLGGTAAGTYIGTKVNVTAESHARPFRGTLKPVVAGLSVKKVWKDAYGNVEPDDVANEHGEVTVKVYQRKKAKDATEWGDWTVYETATLSKDNGWSKSWSKLPKKDKDGTTYEYKVAEASETDGYTSSIEQDGNTWTVINRHVAVGKLTVAKAWDDADDADGVRPDSVVVKIVRSVAGGSQEDVETGIVLNANNGWSYSKDQLPLKDENGNDYTYSVVEDVPTGYAASLSFTSSVDADGNTSWSFSLVNKHEVATTSIYVKKVWDDEDDLDHIRPGEVKIQLGTKGEDGSFTALEGYEPVILSEDNNWGADGGIGWSGLVACANGKKINYVVRELDVEDGYEAKVSDGLSTDDGKTYIFTITNTHETDTLEFSLSGYSVASITEVLEPDDVCYVDPKIYKTLQSHEGRQLADGEFKFELVNEKTGEVVSTASNDASGMVDFDKAGNVAPEGMDASCLKFTQAGTYTYVVKEVSEVKDETVGYSDEVVKFVVNITKGDDGKLVSDGGTYYYYENAGSTQGTAFAADQHPTITNKVRGIVLGLTKVDGNGTGLAGATYGLYTKGADGNELLVATATSNASGKMTFGSVDQSLLGEGLEYWYREISAPAGYELSYAETTHFMVAHNKSGYYLTDLSGNAITDVAAPGVVLEFTEKAVDEETSVVLNKVDSSLSGLKGAKLQVLNAETSEVVDSWTSNGAGHKLSGLTAGVTYVLHEAEAPSGFRKAADVEFRVSEAGAVSIVSGGTATVNGKGVVNAYSGKSSVSLVDYRENEAVKTETVKRSIPQTGDTALSVAPLAIAAVVVIAVGLCLWRRNRS